MPSIAELQKHFFKSRTCFGTLRLTLILVTSLTSAQLPHFCEQFLFMSGFCGIEMVLFGNRIDFQHGSFGQYSGW